MPGRAQAVRSGKDLELAVAHRKPVLAGILGLPETARRHAEPEDLVIGRVAHHRRTAAADGWTHVAPLEGLELGTCAGNGK